MAPFFDKVEEKANHNNFKTFRKIQLLKASHQTMMVEQLVDHATRFKNVQVFLIETHHIRFLMNHPKVRLSGDIIKVKTAASSLDS